MLRRTATRLLSTVLVLVSFFLLSCSRSVVEPDPAPTSPWTEVTIPGDPPSSDLVSIAFQGSRGIALGSVNHSDDYDYLLQTNGSDWTARPLPIDTSALLVDLTLDRSGKGVIVGASVHDSTLTPLVLAEGSDWQQVSLPALSGGFQSVAVDDAGTFLASGVGTSAAVACSGKPGGSWSQVSIPLTGGPQEKGLVDVAYGNGRWVGCGFDDGAEGTEISPFSVLLTDEGPGWKLADRAECGGCGYYEYRAVTCDREGKILLGGARVLHSGEEYDAFLVQYDPAYRYWTTIYLPQPSSLECINDILVTSTGDIYLACGRSSAALVHRSPAGEFVTEWSSDSASIVHLAESVTGEIYAVGGRPDPKVSLLPGYPYYVARAPLMLRRPSNL